ncbi:hypothetical protein, partial [Gluconobacter cerinus]|uniref:hypothetical protein n=1 Tax=Gluconobacter cerinus TaxID=38307 RepID=UPI001B8B5A08
MINYVKAIIKKYSGIILLSIGLLVSLPFFWIGRVDYQLQHPIHFNNTNDAGASAGAFGDFSNWFQALVAMWTLLGVFYAAVKAKQASDSASELTEKAFMGDLFVHMSEKINNEYDKQEILTNKYNKIRDKKEKDLKENREIDYIIKIEEKFNSDIEDLSLDNGGLLMNLSNVLDIIYDVINVIDDSKYVEKEFYKKIFLYYINISVRHE